MNKVSVEPGFEDQKAIESPITGRTAILLTAWTATLLLSKLPLVIARDILGVDIPWIVAGWLAVAGLLLAGTYSWQVLKPLRRYFAVMGILILVTAVIEPLIKHTSVWQGFLAGQPELVLIFADRIFLVIDTLIVLIAVYFMGSRQVPYLKVGNLNAPVQGVGKRLTWPLFATLVTLVLGGLFFAFMASQTPGAFSMISKVILWVPMILISAGLNAFGEEGMYRAAPLGTLLPAVGANQAIWLTSIWFGLGHYYGGIPSGAFGAVQAGLIGLIMGKAMAETRGIALPWMIHLILDTIIYFFIAASM